VAAGGGQTGVYAPVRQQRGAERGCSNFRDTKYTRNSVSSVEAGMGME